MTDQGNGNSFDNNTRANDASDDVTQPMNAEFPPAGQSRRNFLKAAVIGSAGIAAAGGAAAAGLALTGRQVPLIRFIGQVTTYSPNDPCAICTTATSNGYPAQSSFKTGSESIMLWLRFLNVDAGTYSLNVTPSIQTSSTTCSSSNPFVFQSGANGINAFTTTAGSLACSPSSDPGKSASYTALPVNGQTTGNSNSAGSFPITFTIAPVSPATTLDILVQVHMQGCGPANTYTLTTTLTPTGGGATSSDTCSNEITLTS